MDSARPPRLAATVHLIFDLDGTLIDSLPGIARSLNHALAAHELPGHPEVAVRGFIGDGSRMLARRALPDGSPETLVEAVESGFKAHYAEHWADGTARYPGIAELIASLHAAGHRLAVLSNKPHPFTVAIVQRMFPAHPFDPVLGQCDGLPHKPEPDSTRRILETWGVAAAEARFIGDSTVDRETARRAGVPFVAVGWGYHDPERLGPRVAGHPAELPGLMS